MAQTIAEQCLSARVDLGLIQVRALAMHRHRTARLLERAREALACAAALAGGPLRDDEDEVMYLGATPAESIAGAVEQGDGPGRDPFPAV